MQDYLRLWSQNVHFFSGLVHDLFMNIHNFFTISVHDLLMTYIWLVHQNFQDLFTFYSWLVHFFFRTSRHHNLFDLFRMCLCNLNLFISCSLPVLDLFKTFSRVVHDLFITCSLLVLDLFTNFSRVVHRLFITCLWFVYNIFMNYSSFFLDSSITFLQHVGTSDRRCSSGRWLAMMILYCYFHHYFSFHHSLSQPFLIERLPL